MAKDVFYQHTQADEFTVLRDNIQSGTSAKTPSREQGIFFLFEGFSYLCYHSSMFCNHAMLGVHVAVCSIGLGSEGTYTDGVHHGGGSQTEAGRSGY
jgi:hypothetical protein